MRQSSKTIKIRTGKKVKVISRKLLTIEIEEISILAGITKIAETIIETRRETMAIEEEIEVDLLIGDRENRGTVFNMAIGIELPRRGLTSALDKRMGTVENTDNPIGKNLKDDNRILLIPNRIGTARRTIKARNQNQFLK